MASSCSAEDGRHRVVDPEIDGAEGLLEGRGRFLDAVGIGDIALENQCPATSGGDVPSSRFKASPSARE